MIVSPVDIRRGFPYLRLSGPAALTGLGDSLPHVRDLHDQRLRYSSKDNVCVCFRFRGDESGLERLYVPVVLRGPNFGFVITRDIQNSIAWIPIRGLVVLL